MKRTFWTRNLFIGVLMGLVLAFSVQGTADALTFGTSRSGDLQTVDTGDEFTIRFSVNLRSPQALEPNTRRAIQAAINEAATSGGDSGSSDHFDDSSYTDGDTHYYTTTDSTATATNSDGDTLTSIRNWSTESEAYYYNDESVSITSSPTVTLQKGRTDVTSLTETASESDQRLTSSVTLKGEHGTAEVVTITITDTTPLTDFPSDAQPPSTRASVVFTVYIVGDAATTAATDVHLAATSGAVEELEYQVRGNQDSQIFVTVDGGSNLPVTITVNGGGRVYVKAASDRRTSGTTSLSTSSAAPVFLSMNSRTNKVTVNIQSVGSHTATYIYGNPSLEKISGTDQMGLAGGRLDEPLGVRLTDFGGRAISGLPVTFDETDGVFIPIPGQTLYKEGDDIRTATSTRPGDSDDSIIVYTDSRGEAHVYYQFDSTDTSGTIPVTATVADTRATTTFRPEVGTPERRPTIEIVSGNNQRTDEHGDIDDQLVVVVRRDGNRLPGHSVLFATKKGTLTGGTVTNNGKRSTVTTDGRGEAKIRYYQDPGEGSDTVTAEISGNDYEKEVTFNINGGSSTRPPTDPTPPAAPTNRINISLSSSTGEPGDEITVTVRSDPSGRTVRLTSDDFADSLFSPQSETTPFESTLTLPDEDGEYTITAEGFPLEAASATVTVETGILGRITISQIGQPSGGAQNFSIGVADTDGDRISGALTVRVSGSGFTTRNIETLDGFGNARLTLPTTAGLYTLTASAEDYTPGTTQVRIAAPEPPQDTAEEEEEEEEEAPEPASIEISGPSTRTGTANTAIEAALLVQVLDDDDDAVEDARVIFRVRTGQGRLSQRGNGRAIAVQTDSRGYARAEYTPISASSTVEAEVRGVRTPVTFTITATDAAPSTDTPDTGENTPPDTIRPTVLIPPAQRPPMVWVDGGAIYALISTEAQEFIPNLNNVMNLTIGGGKIYWTAKTSASSGTIHSANLDGSGIKELTEIKAIPMGIAVDVPNSKLYWTNSRGRIQSANLDGSGIQNVMQNIRNPNDLALAGGNVYWTESNHGSVRFVNLKGQKQVRVISTGDDPAGSLAIAGGKVYWTEKVGENGGTINSANLNGSGATEIASILATPIGIAVDTARSKLYWTNARGRIQAASLDGSSIRNVVSGLGSPGEIVLSNSIKAPKATTPTKSTTTAAGKNKYDINGDGSVDDTDIDMVIIAFSAGVTSAKYDVNGDGKVDINDVVAVRVNRSKGAASAPTLLGRKFSALEVDRLQAQIDLLIATNDRSPAAMQTLIYLQQLIVMARPEKTQLLANYPNPFNPETWMPYELATDTEVRITIYNAQGVVIRTLQLGQQSAGYYTDRERAAYWDGRNALGEQVASGIYFYQLETDEMSSLRKMVILK